MPTWWKDLFDADYVRVYRALDAHGPKEAEQVRRILKLRRGQRLLDICCGYGRHAIPLAQSGLKVTGFDYSASFLQRARRLARRAGVNVEWVRGDVRRMDFGPVFAAAINMFTAIGYFDTDEENEELVRRAAAALKPGGRLLVETLNHDFLVRHFRPQMWQEIGRGILAEQRIPNWETGHIESRRILTFPDGRRRVQKFRIRFYNAPELSGIFRRSGLVVTHVFSGLDGKPCSVDLPRMVVVGQKPK